MPIDIKRAADGQLLAHNGGNMDEETFKRFVMRVFGLSESEIVVETTDTLIFVFPPELPEDFCREE